MSDEPPQMPGTQRSPDPREQRVYVPPPGLSSQRPLDRPRIEPTYPNQSPQMPYPLYQPAVQQAQPPHVSYNPLDARFWRDMSTSRIAVVTVVLTLLLICVCIGPYMLVAANGRTTVRTGALQPTATTLPTPPPQPTHTPKPAGPQPLSGASLGGTQDGFTAKLGDPTDRSGVPWYTVTLPDGTTANLCYCTEHAGTDGNPHLEWFHIDAPSGVTWSDQQGVAIAHPFFPPDAKHVRDFTDPQIGLIHVYVSADLAATFPAGEFKDSGNGQLLPPGTFGVACGQPGPSQCSITTGD